MNVDFEALAPALAELCRKYGIAELSVFGSAARGEDQPDSDVDFLYVRAPDSVMGMSFFGMQEELEQLLGRHVDLMPQDYLHWLIKDRVLAGARRVYAA